MEDFYYERMASLQERHWWYQGRRNILSEIIYKFKPNTQKTLKILEIGCGTGANIAMLKSFGTVYGAEPHEFARNHTAKQEKCDVRDALLPSNIPFRHNFDVICAFDVIEHIEEDLQSIKAIATRLNKGGMALFTVPAYQWLWSKHDETNHHKRRYTQKEFNKLLKESNLSIEYISYYNFFLFPLVAIIRLTKKTLKLPDTSGDINMPKLPLVNTTLSKLFSSEKHLISKGVRLPFGVSIVAVCKKT